jgi:hypothetical protein
MDYSRQNHITQVLLFDTETCFRMKELVQNAADLYRRFCLIVDVAKYPRYTLVVAFPEERADLMRTAGQLKAAMEKEGIKFRISAVPDTEMFLVKGKQGLLACTHYMIAGYLLQRDGQIPLEEAEGILRDASPGAWGPRYYRWVVAWKRVAGGVALMCFAKIAGDVLVRSTHGRVLWALATIPVLLFVAGAYLLLTAWRKRYLSEAESRG